MISEALRRAFLIYAQLWRCSDSVTRARDKELHQFGVSRIQAGVLRAVKSKETVTVGDVAHFIFRESQSVVGLLNRMESRGLIRRTGDPNDARVRRVVLTERGQALYEQVRRSDVIARMMSVLSPDELEHLSTYLARLHKKALEELSGD